MLTVKEEDGPKESVNRQRMPESVNIRQHSLTVNRVVSVNIRQHRQHVDGSVSQFASGRVRTIAALPAYF